MTHCAVLRVAKLTGAGKIRLAAAHNKRTIQAELGARGHIDAQRTVLNESLHGPSNPEAVAKRANDLMAAAGVTKLRKDAVRALEWLFSLPANNGLDERQYFVDAMVWVAANFGGVENLLCADIHRDEAAPHCHVLVLPLFNGKMQGSDAIGGPGKLRALRSDFYATVAKQYGLGREAKALHGALKHEAVQMVLKRLNTDADTVLCSAVWQPVRDAIQHDPGAFLVALGLQPPRRKLRRTMAQIFTSKGKGRAVEVQSKPYRVCNGASTPVCTEPYAL